MKPENILFANSDPDSDIKVIDFGCSRIYKPLNPTDKMTKKFGTVQIFKF